MTSIQISSHVMGREFTRSSVPPAFVAPIAPRCEPGEHRGPAEEEEPVTRAPEVTARRAPEHVSELPRRHKGREAGHRSREVLRRRPERAEECEHEIEDVRRREGPPRRRPGAEPAP